MLELNHIPAIFLTVYGKAKWKENYRFGNLCMFVCSAIAPKIVTGFNV